MSNKKSYHVTHDDERWQVKAEGNDQASSKHDSKDEAVNKAKEYAKNNGGQVIVHDKNGQIESNEEY
ncbi:DUF2188 domain-containing protein [Staphylococcus massiliensis]|uniref:DUF2188 domain-containing protein n=1 Tax=Staphylococcus massiliensis TaxID=555791 RepID=UPI001EDED85C|nr:DUF2188 domain-containing protein [Staphylococcus massiliensis]MCG3402145.1 DUF2188 domain-containing protein [Staphylococcus massiliensis]